MEFVTIEPRKRHNKPDVIANFKPYNDIQKVNIRIRSNILDSLGVKIGERLSISYDKDNRKVLFLKKDDTGYKISTTNRIFITYPFAIDFDNYQSHKGIPYELKDDGIYLYFDRVS